MGDKFVMDMNKITNDQEFEVRFSEIVMAILYEVSGYGFDDLNSQIFDFSQVRVREVETNINKVEVDEETITVAEFKRLEEKLKEKAKFQNSKGLSLVYFERNVRYEVVKMMMKQEVEDLTEEEILHILNFVIDTIDPNYDEFIRSVGETLEFFVKIRGKK